MKHIRHANTLFYYDGPQVFDPDLTPHRYAVGFL